MKIFKKTFKNINEYLYEHRTIKLIVDYFITFVASLISAFCFAYGFRSFIAPNITTPIGGGEPIEHLISGGISGLSQVIIRLCELAFNQGNDFHANQTNLMQSILYFVINVPLFILGYLKIGKRFAIFSIINVLLVSILITIIPDSWTTIFNLENQFLARAIFAGLLTGVSSSLAVKYGHSAGGIDIISIYISSKTKSSMGKYILGFNFIIIVSFTILKDYSSYANKALYSIVYLFTSSKVVDAMCLRNKKYQLQIITDKEDMAKILISNLPHSCTIVDAKGAYKGTPRKIIYMDVSANEIKLAVKYAQEIDKDAFISVLDVHNLYGKFFIKPLQ